MNSLRHGYSTGSCAAAAAKAALHLLCTGIVKEEVSIPMISGERVSFSISNTSVLETEKKTVATVIKDAGDDPDITNGAEISATVSIHSHTERDSGNVIIIAGKGVGKITKPGLVLKVGEPAINPIPRKMIRAACEEVFSPVKNNKKIVIEISVKDGEKLTEKTLNKRLGIIGGISILGTTGIVKPISASAWKATIITSMDVARSHGINEIVLSTGRTSEDGFLTHNNVPEEALVMMGDFLSFSLTSAYEKGFERIQYAGMWAKLMKGAMGFENTHVDHGVITEKELKIFLSNFDLSSKLQKQLLSANTARHIFQILNKKNAKTINEICLIAKRKFEKTSRLPVNLNLISPEKRIILSC